MVPKQRNTKSKRNRRRSHSALRKIMLVKCSHCGHLIMPHRVCEFCGYYRGKQVIDVMAKLSKRERKLKEKQDEAEKKKAKPLNLEQLSKK